MINFENNPIMRNRIDELRQKFEKQKQFKLIVAIVIDLIGCSSYIIPGFAEISDVLLAPLSAIAVYLLFNKKLKWASFTFIEEFLPFLDIVPSATIAWYYMYVKNQEKTIQDLVNSENQMEEAFKKATFQNDSGKN